MESGAKGCEVRLHGSTYVWCCPIFLQFSKNFHFMTCRLLLVVSSGPSVQNPWSLRMDIWYLPVSRLKNILILLWGTCFLDRWAYFTTHSKWKALQEIPYVFLLFMLIKMSITICTCRVFLESKSRSCLTGTPRASKAPQRLYRMSLQSTHPRMKTSTWGPRLWR